MSKVEQKFSIGDKVVWGDKMYADKYYSHTVESVMSIVKIQQLSGSTLLSMDNDVEAAISALNFTRRKK